MSTQPPQILQCSDSFLRKMDTHPLLMARVEMSRAELLGHPRRRSISMKPLAMAVATV